MGFNPKLTLTFQKGARVEFSIENTNDMDLIINGAELFGTKKVQQTYLEGFLHGLVASGNLGQTQIEEVKELINKTLGL